MSILSAAPPEIRQSEFHALRDLIGRAAGIHLTDAKRSLVASRLASRLRQHGMASYGEYYEHLAHDDPEGAELREMINCITTNKTSFFRESHHFDLLRERVFQPHGADQGPLRIWSAGCSTGEEPYTIAMAATEHFGTRAAARVRVDASDIDTRVLATAQAGVYDEERLQDVPAALRRKHFLRGTGQMAGRVRVDAELRRLITFRRLNLITEAWPWQELFDVIFCRNVIIYFDGPTRARLMERFAQRLKPGGYLILGHSESMHPQQTLFESQGQTVFRLRGGRAAPVRSAPAAPATAPTPPSARVVRPRTAHRTITAGEVYASREPGLVRTVLGSCVAACLFDPVAGVGGMNHFMLPEGADETQVSARYGVHAMELLINDILRQGGDRRRLRAKVFGASAVLNMSGGAMTVPERNARFVREFLELEGIPLLAQQLTGTAPLDVRMRPPTGEVWVRELGRDQLDRTVAEERRYVQQVRATLHRPDAEDVTLF